MSVAQNFNYQRQGRYFLSETPGQQHQYLCLVLHGHGQLPQFFIRKFTALGLKNVLFVAPEGLHRYYLKGNNGRVGATWMTKEQRLQDIADYCQMLEQVTEQVYHLAPFKKRAILGFSQGVATACRFTVNTNYQFDALINWAGAFPPDLDYKKAYANLKDLPVYLVVGKQDEYISEEDLKDHQAFLAQQKLTVKTKLFNGQHDIDGSMLAEVLSEVF